MAKRKPSLLTQVVRNHLWAALITLIVLLLSVLAVTDGVVLYARRNALSEQLYAIESANNAMLMLYEFNNAERQNHAGSLLMDSDGHWVSGPDTDGLPRASEAAHGPLRRWDKAHAVIEHGGLHGMGRLPWTRDVVIWAARPMFNPDGPPMLLVAWEQVNAIRLATTPFYYTVIFTTLLAYGVCLFIGVRTVRDITSVLDGIAESSTHMAAGDYQIRLPEQPTEELDRVSSAITKLAGNLELTTSDLRSEHQRLARLEGLQRQFVADASHELRAPLTSMRVTLEAWEDGVLRPDEQPHALERLLAEIARLSALVGRLLDLSRIESGRATIATAPVFLQDAAADFMQRSAGDGPEVVADIPEHLPPVLGDEDAVHRILVNLVENARRFTPATGSVRIWADVEQTMIRFGVTDTGSGIDAAFLSRIWDRFARSSDARAEGKAGSGLGLAIVKALALEMGGEVGAESPPGQGATVWVRLPIADTPGK